MKSALTHFPRSIRKATTSTGAPPAPPGHSVIRCSESLPLGLSSAHPRKRRISENLEPFQLRPPGSSPAITAGKAAETRIGDESAGAGLLVPSSRQCTGHTAGIRERARDSISRSCLVLGNAAGSYFPASVSPGSRVMRE